MRIGVLTGGGDAPGLNAAIRGVARRALQLGHRVSGVKNGWAGALDGDIDELAPEAVRGILHLGGTILGTSRTNPLKEPDGVKRVMRNLKRFGIDGLVAIGGDDTLSVARAMHEAGALVVGVMGRETGWVAMMGGLAGGADLILIPEFEIKVEDIVAHLYKRRGEGRDFSIIVVAEGVQFEGLATDQSKTDAFGHVQLAQRGVGDALSRL